MIELLAGLLVLGIANLGALIFLLGGLKADVSTLKDWAGKFNLELAEVRDRTAKLEGKTA